MPRLEAVLVLLTLAEALSLWSMKYPCLRGPFQHVTPTCTDYLDYDADGDVDLSDVAMFQNAITE